MKLLLVALAISRPPSLSNLTRSNIGGALVQSVIAVFVTATP